MAQFQGTSIGKAIHNHFETVVKNSIANISSPVKVLLICPPPRPHTDPTSYNVPVSADLDMATLRIYTTVRVLADYGYQATIYFPTPPPKRDPELQKLASLGVDVVDGQDQALWSIFWDEVAKSMPFHIIFDAMWAIDAAQAPDKAIE